MCKCSLVHLLINTFATYHKISHLHTRLGYGSCLVHTEHIYPRKCLYALHVMKKNLLFGKPDCTERKCHCCQQVKSLRDHAQNGCNHGYHALAKCLMIEQICLAEKYGTYRYDDYSDPFDELIDVADHLRLFALAHRLCLGCEL